MNLTNYSIFLSASFLLLIFPGPNMLAVISRGIQFGKKAAFLTVLGYGLGDMLQTFLAVVGLSAIISSSLIALKFLQYSGSAYLIYLGVRMILTKQEKAENEMPIISHKGILMHSAVASILNPKTVLFFIAFLPQFVAPENGFLTLQLLILGFSFTLLGIIMYLPIALFSVKIGELLKSSERIGKRVNWISGSIFIFLGILLGTSKITE